MKNDPSSFSALFSPHLLSRSEGLLENYRARGLTLSIAESCTGGLLAGLLTEIAGASDVLVMGVVSYANSSKQKLLAVRAETLQHYGAVSAECAQEMAVGVQKILGTDVAISITGIAGPGGGSRAKPVGLVYFGVSTHKNNSPQLETAVCHFGPLTRTEIRLQAVNYALGLLESVVL